METLKVNDIVTVYQNHLTKEHPEGQAKLIKRLPDNRDSELSENWKVRFTSDGYVCERMVSL